MNSYKFGNFNKHRISNTLKIILNKIYIYYFHPKYIRDGLEKRKGGCKICGECCRNLLNIGIKCPFLKINNLCRIHKFKKYLPLIREFCYLSPSIEEFKVYKKEYKNKKCGYYWDV